MVVTSHRDGELQDSGGERLRVVREVSTSSSSVRMTRSSSPDCQDPELALVSPHHLDSPGEVVTGESEGGVVVSPPPGRADGAQCGQVGRAAHWSREAVRTWMVRLLQSGEEEAEAG